MSVLGELKRRNVFRVILAYLASAWVLIEIASILFPALGFDRAVLQWLIAGLALGLVPLVWLSWRYELTARGLVRDRGPGAEGSENLGTARRLDQVTIAMVLAALGVAAFQRFAGPERIAQVVGTAPVATVSVPAPPPPVPLPPADPNSLAVLPFKNLSPDPENEYFAEGVADEVLTVVARIPGLKVASRTSAFSFKGGTASLDEIARTLRVAHVLDGSVRRQDGRVRITVQLIDVAKGFQMWSENYDRELTDIFAVQEEIARAIAGALGNALGLEAAAEPVRVAKATDDLQAYELYLRGRQLFYQRGESLLPAGELLEDAVERDPKFAQAWAVLAAAYLASPDYVRVPRADQYAKARDAAQRARELDDSIALAPAVLGQLAANSGDLLESERLLDEAIRRDPGDSTSWVWRSMTYLRAGDFARAEADAARAVERDPLIGITHGWYGLILGLRGDAAGRDQHLARSAELGWNWAHWLMWRFALEAGDRVEAARRFRLYADSVPAAAPSTRAAMDALHAAILDPTKIDAAVVAVRADTAGVQNSGWASTLAGLGLHEEAIDIELDPDLPHGDRFGREIWYPGAIGIVSLPRFLEIAERDGLLAWWAEKGYPDGCRLVDAPERHLDCAERQP
jgi:TolB-like protein/Tfp pilus assembly protein PilF